MIIEIFYDATCPFCVKRAQWIRKRDVRKDIRLSDVNKEAFMLKLFGVDEADAHEDVHAVYRNGTVINGAEVVRATLDILGYKKTLRLINFPIVRDIFNWTYKKIARNRHRIGW